jgi:DNA-binding MarR family transcriptional regulator
MAKKKSSAPAATDEASFRARLEAGKGESTLQLLFKAARLLDELALERVSQRKGRPRLRRSHTSLLPHIDLEGTRITDLAERLGVTKQAASQLVDDLEAIGVLAREPDPDDARARRVVFTRLGREGLLEGLALLRDMESELARSIGDDSMAGLRRALVAILATLQPPDP